MLRRFTLAFLILSVATFSGAGVVPDTNVYVYVSDRAGACFLGLYSPVPQVYGVYVDSGDYTDVSGVGFRIGGELFGPEQVVSVTTPPDVSIAGGDIFSGITLTFSSRALAHDPVLFIEVSSVADYGNVVTQNVSITRGGGNEFIPDFYTYREVVDCFGSAPNWFPPDTVDVVVDQDESFSFKALVSTNDIPAVTKVIATDANGWIPAPVDQWVHGSCFWCPWDYTLVTVSVHVPKGTADGTLDPVPFQITSYGYVLDEKTVVLRAVEGVATEETTWGRVKALYR